MNTSTGTGQRIALGRLVAVQVYSVHIVLLLLGFLQYGCLVVNAPTANTVAAAEHGIALMCALSRNVAQADASMKQQKWERNKYVGVSLVDKTLAIMGFGKVRLRIIGSCRWLCMI